MTILGISDHFTAGASIIRDGLVVAAINEERLARKKMVMGFPRKSIAAVIELAGVKPSEIDYVAVASQWGHFLNEYVNFDNGVFGVDEGVVKGLFFSIGSKLSFLRTKAPFLEGLYYDLRRPAYARRRSMTRQVLAKEFGITCPVHFMSHHYSHATAAYFASGFDDALLVSLDGAGDGHSSHVYHVRNGEWHHLQTVPSFDSVGDYYGYVTQLSGFKAGKHEGKITGLAAYGKPTYRPILDQFIRYENGTMVNAGNCFRHAALQKLAAALPKDFSREDLATSVQELAEDVTCRYISYWREKTGARNIAVAGGVFANVKINQRVHELPGVESIFVYPAMSDEGISAGAALGLWDQKRVDKRSRPARCFDHVYLGPDFEERDIASALEKEGVAFTRPAKPEHEIARLVADGYVVARVNGRMEYGPRALGNRSILYRPDDPSVNAWLNERLRRTEFMPFAPSTLVEEANACFQNVKGAEDTARFMTITFDCTDMMKEKCPGVVHIDGTARPQLVGPGDNPSYYEIIKEFQRLTGLPSIVNTSFNIHEEPIVCTPHDAIRAFKIGHLDVLAIGNLVAMNPNLDLEGRAVPASAQAKRSS